ncbi:hypothetical protein [Streptomyces boninensis]|uniref:hypothetical protein n=1 Tax=Streptomyces boninensis TaxID=2039455 RepID=UPI003B227CBB
MLWRDGRLIDLGVPKVCVKSEATWISEWGDVFGIAYYEQTDGESVVLRSRAYRWRAA